jgi:hypothetical protein
MSLFYLSPLAALSWSSANAQELEAPRMAEATTVQGSVQPNDIQANGVQDSVESDNNDESVPGHVFNYGPIGVHFDSTVSVVYNDNIYIQPTHRTSDLIWTVAPEITLGAGDYVRQEESWGTLHYAPSIVLFTDHGNNDAVNQDVLLRFEWLPANWTFGLKQEYQENSGPVVEAGNRINRSVYNTSVYIKYDFSPKTQFELDGNQSVNAYGLPLFSYNTWTASGWINYWLTPKIRLGMGGVGGFIDVTQNPNQIYQQALFRAEYDMSENASFYGSAGAELREFQSGQKNKANGVFSLGGTYKPWVNTELLIEAYRGDETSLVAASENYTLTGFSLGIRQAVFDKYVFSLAAGFDHSDYYATAPGAATNGQFNYLFVRPGFDFQITQQLTAGLFYQYQQNRSSQDNAFTGNQTGINLTYHF